MKYKLKRDLPFAKAGAEVMIGNTRGDYTFVYVLNNNGSVFPGSDVITEDLHNWIEEVKPREFVIGLEENGCVVTYVAGDTIATCNNGQSNYDTSYRIKVREIIE